MKSIPSPTRGEGLTTPRFPAFDRLRAFSMLFIVVFHSALAYGQGMPWQIKDPNRSAAFGLAIWATIGFTLRIFFVMAGFFARMLYERRGPSSFLNHRVVRIGIPFVVGVILWSPVVSSRRGEPFALRPMHFWFLEYLLLTSLIVAAGSTQLRSILPPKVLIKADMWFRRLVANWWAPIALGVLTAALLTLQGVEPDPSSIETPESFVPHGVVLTYYTLFFAFGWMLHRCADVLPTFTRSYRSHLLCGVVIRAIGAVLFLARLDRQKRGLEPLLALDVALYLQAGLFTWLMVFGFIGWFERRFAKDTVLARYVSESAYWCYLIHPLAVTTLQRWLISVGMPALAKFLLVASISMIFCFVTYEYLCRYTFVGAVLNGRRTRPAGPRSLAWMQPSEKSADARSG